DHPVRGGAAPPRHIQSSFSQHGAQTLTHRGSQCLGERAARCGARRLCAVKAANFPNAPAPIRDGDRADVLDALRGFALLGIFISHAPDFSGHSFMTPAAQAALDRFGFDGAAALLQDFLIRGKFYSLFSLLFGVGFAIQLQSATKRGADFARHFARRLAILLVIGLVHASLWYGDILKDYALIGFALLFFRRSSATILAGAAVFVFALRMLWPLLVWA